MAEYLRTSPSLNSKFAVHFAFARLWRSPCCILTSPNLKLLKIWIQSALWKTLKFFIFMTKFETCKHIKTWTLLYLEFVWSCSELRLWIYENHIYEPRITKLLWKRSWQSDNYLSSSENKAWKWFRPVGDLHPLPSRCRCSALPTELTSQLGADYFLGSKLNREVRWIWKLLVTSRTAVYFWTTFLSLVSDN